MKRTTINLSNLDNNTITKLIRMLVKELAKAQKANQELQAQQQTGAIPFAKVHMCERLRGQTKKEG